MSKSKDKITRDSGIPFYVEALIMDGEIFEAAKELRMATGCSIQDAILAVKKWRKDRAKKIGR